jgi:isoleucyl-tRNA synthetase
VFVKDADKDIIRNLKDRGLLYKRQQILHTYPFCWRCDSPLIYIARNSWYIRTTDFAERMLTSTPGELVPAVRGREALWRVAGEQCGLGPLA